jgi:hypothetical protein
MIKNFTLTGLSMLWILLISSPLLAAHTSLSPSFFQSDVIRGKIVDEAGAGLPGVNVIIKGTSNGTTSDATGGYVLNLPENSAGASLVFSFIGYSTQEQPINGRSTIDVTLASDVTSLSEIIVVGYGTQEKGFRRGDSKNTNQQCDGRHERANCRC